MSGSEITYQVWSDFANVARTRGAPTRDLERRMAHGLGWAIAARR